MKRSIKSVGLLAMTVSCLQAQLIWVNEFHYDNSGTDVGEFFEIATPSSFTDLSSVTLTLYRGDGSSYGSHKLSTFTLGSTSGSYAFYSKSISGIQNGPDGFALDQSGTVLQFLSYEGTPFQATSGVASGLASAVIGVSESGSTAIGASLGLTGSGRTYADFSWSTFADDTPGGINTGQTFSAAPEPRGCVLVAAIGLLAFAAFRRSAIGRRCVPARGSPNPQREIASFQ